MNRQVYEFISKQTQDPIVQWKTCEISGKEFAIYKSDLDFYDKISPVYKPHLSSFDKGGGDEGAGGFSIPTPTLCPEERQRRRLMFRNERKLYKRKCDLTGKNIISIYSPESPYKVYDQKAWRSDAWNPMSYGKDFDFGRKFTEQFGELMEEVPQLGAVIMNPDNSEYTNGGVGNKNCYLVFVASHNEDCMYARWIFDSKNLTDCEFCYNCQHGFELDNCNTCTSCQYCTNCKDCYKCDFSINCNGCSHCFGCSNLINKSYCINNKQYTKETFDQVKKEILQKNDPYVTVKQIACNKSFGSQIDSCNGVVFGYSGEKAQNCKYIYDFLDVQDSQDINFQGYECSLLYESVGFEKIYNCISILLCVGCRDIYYSYLCFDSSNLFGCIGLRNKSYCIFNKQYTKEEYEILVAKIISKMQETGERGEFFDPSLSPFGYNETVAQEYSPLTRDEALARGYKRQDKEYPINIPEGLERILAEDVPTNILDITDNILNKVIICEVSGKPFRLVKPELEFYRKHNLPVPHKHSDVRHTERLAKRPGRELFLRNCDKCNTQMLSVYPNIEESKDTNIKRVYCEQCYNHEIYG